MPRPVPWPWGMLADPAQVPCPTQEVRVGRVLPATASWSERKVRFHEDRHREDGGRVGRSGGGEPSAAALASLGGNLQGQSRFPSRSSGLMGNGKQSTEAASGQGVGGARRCLLTESVINSFRVAAPPLISTACPLGLSLLSPNR